MALLQKGMAAATSRMPKFISPKGHAIADYANLGIFVLMTMLFWKRNRRAAVGALIAGAAEAGNTLLTDFPGGVVRLIDFPTHGRIDMGLAAATFALPSMMRFDDDPEAKYFRMIALNLTAVAGLTDFEGSRENRRRRRAA